MDARAKAKELYDNTMAELDLLEKSQKTGDEATDDLEALTKSLEAELAGDDPLKKSGDNDADDKGGKTEDDEETEMEKSLRLAAEEELRKAQEAEQEEYDELVKASEAYAALEETIQKSHGGIQEQLSTLCKSMAALTNLNLKMAGVITAQSGEIATLKKSREEDLETIQKSVATLGGRPVMPNTAVLGVKLVDGKEEALTKSLSEIGDDLTKAVQEGKIDSRHLSVWGTYKDVNRLPDEVKTLIGI